MQRSRRAVLATVPVALAGCGRSLRENAVPGGLHLRNRRAESTTVSVRGALLPEPAGGESESTTATPATPRDVDLEDPEVTGEYTVSSGGERAVPDFFPQAGRWAFEAVVDGAGDRTRIQLYAAIPGPTGADSVLVRISGDGVTAEATTIDD